MASGLDDAAVVGGEAVGLALAVLSFGEGVRPTTPTRTEVMAECLYVCLKLGIDLPPNRLSVRIDS
jgi:hypothetical protein